MKGKRIIWMAVLCCAALLLSGCAAVDETDWEMEADGNRVFLRFVNGIATVIFEMDGQSGMAVGPYTLTGDTLQIQDNKSGMLIEVEYRKRGDRLTLYYAGLSAVLSPVK